MSMIYHTPPRDSFLPNPMNLASGETIEYKVKKEREYWVEDHGTKCNGKCAYGFVCGGYEYYGFDCTGKCFFEHYYDRNNLLLLNLNFYYFDRRECQLLGRENQLKVNKVTVEPMEWYGEKGITLFDETSNHCLSVVCSRENQVDIFTTFIGDPSTLTNPTTALLFDIYEPPGLNLYYDFTIKGEAKPKLIKHLDRKYLIILTPENDDFDSFRFTADVILLSGPKLERLYRVPAIKMTMLRPIQLEHFSFSLEVETFLNISDGSIYFHCESSNQLIEICLKNNTQRYEYAISNYAKLYFLRHPKRGELGTVLYLDQINGSSIFVFCENNTKLKIVRFKNGKRHFLDGFIVLDKEFDPFRLPPQVRMKGLHTPIDQTFVRFTSGDTRFVNIATGYTIHNATSNISLNWNSEEIVEHRYVTEDGSSYSTIKVHRANLGEPHNTLKYISRLAVLKYFRRDFLSHSNLPENMKIYLGVKGTIHLPEGVRPEYLVD